MAAAYPQALFSWTNRVNGQTVYAADPNELAAEIDATEAILGTNPQNEQNPFTNSIAKYATVSARLSAANGQTTHPYVTMVSKNFKVAHHAFPGVWNPGSTSKPTGAPGTVYPAYYGTGGNLTIQDAGLWLIEFNQIWLNASSGWVMTDLYVGSGIVSRNVFSYDQFPKSGSNAYGEKFEGLDGHTHNSFLGTIGKGTVVRVMSQNATPTSPLTVAFANMNAYFLRPV